MRPDIRAATVIIIRRHGEYLSGGFLSLRWAISPWDAWHTRDAAVARAVADKVCGTMYLFNPVAGQLREYRRKDHAHD